jgi:phage terminase large subunit-like protein
LSRTFRAGEAVRPVDHCAAFCASLTQSDDRWAGQPLKLEAWQRRFWREALEDWRSVVLIVARKNGKTSMLAAFALYELVYGEGRPEILLAAASDRQAGRLFDAAARFVRRHPGLSERLRVRDHEGTIVREDGLGSIIRLTSDPSRLYGYSPTLVVCDELAFWTTPSLRRAYAALTSGGGARTAPRTFTITTAGEAAHRHDSLLGTILDAALDVDDLERKPGLTIARLHAARTLVYAYEAPTADPHDVKAMKLANPASWITLDYVRRQAENPELTDAQVLQLHGCVWAESSSTWIPPAAWQACADPDYQAPDRTRVVLGFDGSYRGDSTALVGATVEERPYLWIVGLWERPDRAPAEWVVDREQVDGTVHAAMDRFDVCELACDPFGWHAELARWADAYGQVVLEFPTNQRSRMGVAVSRFTSAVMTGGLAHDGDPRLARHIGHVVARETTEGRCSGKTRRRLRDGSTRQSPP